VARMFSLIWQRLLERGASLSWTMCSDPEVEPCRICDDIRLIVADGPILELQTEWDAPQYTRGCKNGLLQGGLVVGTH
jgi:hypothetical protein